MTDRYPDEGVFSDQSFGVVPVFIHQDGKIEVCVVQQKGGAHWCFPKGHPEKDETPLETAKRELKEETGLEFESLLFNEVLNEVYSFRRKQCHVRKRVTYYICKVKNQKLHLQEHEVVDAKWLEINFAPSVFTFEEGKKVCRKAATLLQGGNECQKH